MTDTTDTTDHNAPATPDSFVIVLPCPWGFRDGDFLEEAHIEHWHEEIEVSMEPIAPDGDGQEEGAVLGRGRVVFGDGVEAELLVEPPIPELVQLTPVSREPFSATELVLLREHKSTWRVVIKGGLGRGRRAARRAGELMASFVEAGACGAFMPGLITIHSAGMIRHQTMDMSSPEAQVNLFLGATHEDDWMWTRGLTAFGLPELETQTTQGMNDAYFRLMDVAANMILHAAPFDPGKQLQIGHKLFTVARGPHAPEDQDTPMNGIFGRLAIIAR